MRRSRPLTSWLPSRGRPSSLRSHFLFVVAVALVPLLAFSVATVALFAHEARTTFQRGANERTLALLTAVDTELKRSVAALEALATSRNLDSGDVEAFRREASRVLASRPEWLNIHLAPPTGLQVMNLIRPGDRPFHRVIDVATFDRVLHTGRPVVGNLIREPISGRHAFPVRVPVIRQDQVAYVLSALVRTEVIDGLLSPQGLPEDWVGVVLDAQQTIVARTVASDLVGRPASDSLRGALDASGHGWFQGSTIEGWPVYTPFHRSDYSGWAVAIGIPARTVDAALDRSLALLLGLGALVLAAGVGLAWALSSRSTRSLEQLAGMAEHLGRDGSALAADGAGASSGIAEVDELRRSFVEAAGLIRLRSKERDRVEASLRAVEAELRASEQRKDHFLAMLGHELRNPLGVIATAVQLLRTSSSEVPPEPALMIERQVRQMTRLLDDLLDVARIAEGRIQVKQEPCDLLEIVSDLVEDYREAFRRSHLELQLDLPDHPLWLKGDRVRLGQALGNVLQNAEKYSEPGGTVTVRVREEPGAERSWAVVKVQDTGVGMEPEMIECAFESFSQADRTLARSRGGLGLGLALVKGLIELHAGTVKITSEGSGRGTEVTLRLPLETSMVPLLPARASAEPGTERCRRILIVEDNELAALSMQLCLERLGHTVKVARTGPGGIDAAEDFVPEVVLCDVGLPGCDGHEVARTLRRMDATRKACLVAMSGYGLASDRDRSLQAGFDVHLTKPVDLDALREILEVASPRAA